MQSLQQFIVSITYFIGNVLLPLLFGLALLFFIYNTFKFYILEGGHHKEEAKKMALYGIAAFVLLVSIWGIVNLFLNGLGLGNDNPVKPDYFGTSRSGSGSGSYLEFNFGGGNSNTNQQSDFWDTTGAP
jgi:hypothetical protein